MVGMGGMSGCKYKLWWLFVLVKEGLLRCLDYFDVVVCKEWWWFVRLLFDVGIFMVVDRVVFVVYCQFYSKWVEVEFKWCEIFVFIKILFGYVQQSLWILIVNK